MTIKEKAMKTSQIYRADSAPQAHESALRGRMQRLGLTLLACALVLGVTGTASAADARDEAAVRALGDNFAKRFRSEECRTPSIAIHTRWNLRDTGR